MRHCYGALGRSGSIALIERFFRTLKAITEKRDRPPLLRADLERRLVVALAYYGWLRPQQGLGGATPAETLRGQPSTCRSSIPLPRGRPGGVVLLTAPFEIRYLDLERRLPYLAPRAA